MSVIQPKMHALDEPLVQPLDLQQHSECVPGSPCDFQCSRAADFLRSGSHLLQVWPGAGQLPGAPGGLGWKEGFSSLRVKHPSKIDPGTGRWWF